METCDELSIINRKIKLFTGVSLEDDSHLKFFFVALNDSFACLAKFRLL